MDKNLFLKNMEEMIAIAKTNGNQIDHKELLDYFSDYDLNEEAKKLLSEHRESLDKIAAFLIEKETITGKEFMKIFHEVEGIAEE